MLLLKIYCYYTISCTNKSLLSKGIQAKYCLNGKNEGSLSTLYRYLLKDSYTLKEFCCGLQNLIRFYMVYVGTRCSTWVPSDHNSYHKRYRIPFKSKIVNNYSQHVSKIVSVTSGVSNWYFFLAVNPKFNCKLGNF